MVLVMSDRFSRLLSLMALAVEVALRFLIPAALCIAYIVGAVLEYDRIYPNPRDHFTPTRAIATIAILSVTLMWLAWRFVQFVRKPASSQRSGGVKAEPHDAMDSPQPRG